MARDFLVIAKIPDGHGRYETAGGPVKEQRATGQSGLSGGSSPAGSGWRSTFRTIDTIE